MQRPRALNRSFASVRDDGVIRDAATWTKLIGPRAPQPIDGKKLLIRDNADATKRKIIFVSKDPRIDARPGIVVDPATNGAFVQVSNNDGTGESACLGLPSSGGSWLAVGSGDRVAYKYKDRDFINGPCKTAMIKHGKLLKVVCQAKVQPIQYSLDEPVQASVALHFTSGEVTYCAVFGGTIKRDSGTDPPNAGGKGMFSDKDAVAPAGCPVPPVACP